MAQVIQIGQPANEPERQGIAYLRDHLPAAYRVLHNFELRSDNGQWFEIDIAIVAPHAIYLVDVKSTYGEIHVAGGKWHPEGRTPFASPLAKLRHHTRLLHGLLSASAGLHHSALRHVWVEAMVLLTAPDSVLRDPEGRDRDHVVKLSGCENVFTDAGLLPDRIPLRSPTTPHIGQILSTLTGKARPQQGLPLLGRSWQCEERLTANDFYTEYRARNAYASSPERVIVRVYRADPYLPPDERALQRERIANAYTALSRLAAHPAIPAARDFFPTERDDAYVLVLNDAPGSSLRLRLTKPGLYLTMDQKLRVASDLLSALAHCHAHGVLHRAISPSTLVVGVDGQTRLTDFDFARPGPPRDHTLAHELREVIDPVYLAPEVKDDPLTSSTASDVYAAGATIYELFTGKPTFSSLDESLAATQVFPEKASSLVPGLAEGFDSWLECLCRFGAADRPSAADALAGFQNLFTPVAAESSSAEDSPIPAVVDYTNLQPGTVLKNKYLVEGPLGKGGFGRVYKVIDTFGDVTRALKIITTDRTSTFERMKQEYRTLANLPDHPSVVRVYDGDFLEGDQVPFLVMEYVEGANVADLISEKKLSVAEAYQLGIGVADGLSHLHRLRVTHGDIKPANLMWTNKVVRIVDFNVAIRTGDSSARGGGTRRYLPPDFDIESTQTDADRVDRDVYALGVTLYEAMTGEYPWQKADIPPKHEAARDPREWSGFEDLSPALASLLLKATAPRRADRFPSAEHLARSLRAIGALRQPNLSRDQQITTQSFQILAAAGPPKPNTNPFVSYLLTLYSQSRRTNAGTRGLDAMGRLIYVQTALDRELQPATLRGDFRLVLISGNAGDGKTAFIQQVEDEARKRGADVQPYGSGNGTRFDLDGRQFQTNYDGSQDEGDKVNDDVLHQFFALFAGADPTTWPDDSTRIIAINEGRLIDFLEQFGATFPALKNVLQRGLRTEAPEDGVAVVNLNLRSVVAASAETPSILERLVRRLVEPKFWAPCRNCDLRDRCYVHHNVQTLANPTAGSQVLERLTLLYRLVTLRAKLHITLRDLRSALAFTIAGTRSCEEIHELYEQGDREEIARGFYFNSWAGAGAGAAHHDRLLRLLQEVDIGRIGDPKLDRQFDFHPPDPSPSLMDFSPRGRYDRELLLAAFQSLPMELRSHHNATRFARHREYVAMLRRQHFFEARDDSWRDIIPYSSSKKMVGLLAEHPEPRAAALNIIRAINRGEGIVDTRRLKGKLALQVRQVEAATVRSYRVFPSEYFALVPQEPAQASPYLEHSPTALLLKYSDGTDLQAELVINLDVFEMLDRLNQGYRPTVDELQGYYLSLAVFKNILGSAPYQEVLLTPTGHEFYSVTRSSDGQLAMRLSEEGVAYGA